MMDRITPVILTHNEEVNIGRTLSYLSWAKRIVVVDSFSNDKTVDIVRKYPQVEIFQRKFDSYKDQWNYGLDLVQTEWILSLDADYIIPESLSVEMRGVIGSAACDGFLAKLQFCVDGVPLKCSVLPGRVVLFKKSKGTYYQDGHTQRLGLKGKCCALNHAILHDDRKPFRRWLNAQRRYAKQEAAKLFGMKYRSLTAADKMRKLVVLAPVLMPLYVLIMKQGIWDGNRGLYYAYLRTYYEAILAFEVVHQYMMLVFGKRGMIDQKSQIS